MRICFLAPANNYHTQKWCKWFSNHGHEIHVISFVKGSIPNVNVHYIDTGATADSRDFKKLLYFTIIREVKRIIKSISPDIVNAHYASSYGVITALSGVDSFILSVWGSDIYDFPQKSVFHKLLVKYCLKKSSLILSTSKAMAIETKKYTNKNIIITPFGVDLDLFNPAKRNRFNEKLFIIGTVKTLAPKYGIDYLIKATALIHFSHPEIPLQLRISGDGESMKDLQLLARKEGIDNITVWNGFISQSEAAVEWANMDVAVIPSTLESESFGVSAVEAEACSIPVIITDIPGLKEATIPNQSSIVVEKCNYNQLAEAILDLYYNQDKRIQLGKRGKAFVENNYELNKCFKWIESVFENFTNTL